jgi:hypothetical protein
MFEGKESMMAEVSGEEEWKVKVQRESHSWISWACP